jgi:uncharacterized protein YbjT (DUF2867 family)
MRITVTGGTGFVGRHLARALAAGGHEVVLLARGLDRREEAVRRLPGIRFAAGDVADPASLAEAFQGAQAVAHCGGINREIGRQTFERVHVEGTRNVVEAARRAGVKKITLMSFLRARPACGSPYHESKWAAEEIVRGSGLDFTILKAGVIYGRGDHMLDHLSHALLTFPFFLLVGLRERPFRPAAIEDLVRILVASLVEGRMSRRTVFVLGPESMALSEGVRRVAAVLGKRRPFFRFPVAFHLALAWLFERTMTVPLVSTAQVRMLAEGMVEPAGPSEGLPDDLLPRIPFSDEQIRKGLPEAKRFGLRDLRPFA